MSLNIDIRSKSQINIIYQINARILLIVGSIIFLLPLFWMLSTSLKLHEQIFVRPPIWVPHPIMWRNYLDALTFIPFFSYLKNTVYVCTLSVIGTLLSNSLVAYGFSRIKWPGRDIMFMLVLATLMIPYQVIMIPLFVIFKNLGWVNSFRPLWIPTFFGNAFFIFLLRQFFLTIPLELSEVAKIDGASDFCIYLRIILPLAKPVLAVVALFEFLGSWKDFLGPLIYINDSNKYTLSLGLQQFQTQHGGEWALLMSAATMMIAPIIILFFFTQKTFIQGITLTGLKE